MQFDLVPQRSPNLLQFVRRLQFLRLLLFALINGFLFWAALLGPLQDRIGTSLWATAGFCLVVVIIPWFLVETFPAPVAFRPGEGSAADWLFRERAKTVALILLSATVINIYLQQTQEPFWEWAGAVLGMMALAWIAWICRYPLRAGWRENWRVIKGEKKGGGWPEAKAQMRQIFKRDRSVD